MKSLTQIFVAAGGLSVLGALAFGLSGCGTVDEGGGVYVDAYGDYGAGGPWFYHDRDWVGGGYARPPYHPDEHHEAVSHDRPEPSRSAPAPSRGGGGVPSIPNAPRGGGGGGGGGHSGGGGGHSGGEGGGSNDHKH